MHLFGFFDCFGRSGSGQVSRQALRALCFLLDLYDPPDGRRTGFYEAVVQPNRIADHLRREAMSMEVAGAVRHGSGVWMGYAWGIEPPT